MEREKAQAVENPRRIIIKAKKMKLLKFKYPKLTGLIVAIILSYIIFTNQNVADFIFNLGDLSYLGTFIAGMLFAFGFTAPFSAGFFITLNPSNILISGIIGGLGALFSDLLIFQFIRISFKDEFDRLEKNKQIKKIENIINNSLGKKIKNYILYVFAGILIASPLPDEVGITMLAGLTKIKLKVLVILSFLLNTLGILILLII